MTMCHEKGRTCDWPWEYSDDESDLSDEYWPYGELPDYSFNDESKSHHKKPEKPQDKKPYGPEPKTPYGKPPVVPKHASGPEGGERPQALYATRHPANTYDPPYNKGKFA
jgi:hypothetical protein